jgi:hypothetical protein
MIFKSMEVLRTGRVYLESYDETNDTYVLMPGHTLCIQEKDHGYALNWLRIEIAAFYARILVMIVYLVHARLDKATSESKMLVVTDILNEEIALELNKKEKDAASHNIIFINDCTL